MRARQHEAPLVAQLELLFDAAGVFDGGRRHHEQLAVVEGFLPHFQQLQRVALQRGQSYSSTSSAIA